MLWISEALSCPAPGTGAHFDHTADTAVPGDTSGTLLTSGIFF